MGVIEDEVRAELKASEVDYGIMSTTVAIREQIMEYFKDSVHRMVLQTNVRRTSDNSYQRSGTWAGRRTYENDNPQVVVIGSTPIIRLRKNPNRVTLLLSLDRSKQFREIKKNVEEFLAEYLSKVVVEKELREETTNAN